MYNGPTVVSVAVYYPPGGRRRVGKSRLVEEFAHASGCPYVYYTAVQQSSEVELGRFVEAIEGSATPRAADIRAGLRPHSWEAALALVAEGASRERPLILVIDEFPYLALKEPSIEALLRKVWDRALQAAPILIVLIGSDEAMMRALTEQGRPLYDRLREMVVRPLSPAAIGELLDLEPADALDLAAARSEVPGADGNTLLLGVSSRGFDDGVPLDLRVSPQDLVSAWRNGSAPAPGG